MPVLLSVNCMQFLHYLLLLSVKCYSLAEQSTATYTRRDVFDLDMLSVSQNSL